MCSSGSQPILRNFIYDFMPLTLHTVCAFYDYFMTSFMIIRFLSYNHLPWPVHSHTSLCGVSLITYSISQYDVMIQGAPYKDPISILIIPQAPKTTISNLVFVIHFNALPFDGASLLKCFPSKLVPKTFRSRSLFSPYNWERINRILKPKSNTDVT